MGISGLWEHLPTMSREESLLELTLKHGFEANPNGLRACRIGIDASLWLYHSQKVMGQARNGELQMFFHRCCRLLAVPVLPLFVFDGPERPAFKRNKDVRIMANTQLNELRELIAAFGFECVTAPGEAEAALAQLNTMGIIDAILSDDGDCFLFGAKIVLRSTKTNLKSKYMDYLNVYSIQNFEDSSFSRDELLLIALLRGGDYDSVGLAGCGITTAVNLRHLGFGKRLVQHWNERNHSSKSWSHFLSLWRAELQKELLSNSSGEFSQVNRRAAKSITDAFPNDEVISAYLSPIVFHENEINYIRKNIWNSKLSLSRLSTFCLNRFEWGTESKIFETFRSLVWPGAVMRMLLYTIRNADNGDLAELPFEIVSIGQKLKARIECTSIRLSTRSFVQETKRGIYLASPLTEDTISFPWRLTQKDREILANRDDGDTFECFWVPSSVISIICSLQLEMKAKGSFQNKEIIYISSDSE